MQDASEHQYFTSKDAREQEPVDGARGVRNCVVLVAIDVPHNFLPCILTHFYFAQNQ